MTLIEEIKNIVSRLQRFREATLTKHFTQEQIDLINSYPSNETFKIKMLRTAGYGKCKTCGKDTDYVEKIRFYVFCCRECELTSSKNTRKNEFLEELKSYDLELMEGNDFENVDSVVKLKCLNKGHIITSTIKQLRYRNKGCKHCNQLK